VVLIKAALESKLFPETVQIQRLETADELSQGILRQFLGFFRQRIENRQQGFREAGQVPVGDGRLISPGVAGVFIDITKNAIRVEIVHKGTGAVIDRLA
jgi:hypothetical protein